MSRQTDTVAMSAGGPDFLGLGAQKAGTTWLQEMLSLHPDILFPAGKEVHFWNREHHRGLRWYLDLFAERVAIGVQQGEITPAYAILEAERIREIRRILPQVRLFYVLRNPMDRAWSSALMALSRAEMTLEEASDQWFIDHFRSRGSTGRGDYESCLRRWLSEFPREQLLIERYESIAREPRALLERIADHIGVRGDFYRAVQTDRLHERIFGGPGTPVRDSLRPVLHELYADKIDSLSRYLGTDLGWID